MGEKKMIKKMAVSVPSSIEEIIKKLGRVGILQRQIGRVNAALDNSVAKLTQRAAERINPRQQEIEELAQGIFIFSQAHRQELTEEEKKKTIVWPTGEISWRWNPYSVDYRNKEAAIAALKAEGLDRFIRIEEVVNKEAILQEKDAIKGVKGITIIHKEMFIIKPAKTEIEIPKEIKLPKTKTQKK